MKYVVIGLARFVGFILLLPILMPLALIDALRLLGGAEDGLWLDFIMRYLFD